MTFRPEVRARGLTAIADYEPGVRFGPRTLTDFEFVWMVHGTARWRTTASTEPEILLRPGTLSLARAGTTDSYLWDTRQSARHAYLHFTVEAPGPGGNSGPWPVTRSLADHSVLAGLCDYLIALGGTDSGDARDRTDQVLGLLLTVFVAGPLLSASPALPPALAAVTSHVRRVWGADGMRILEVAELAAAAQVSPGHLFRLFRGLGPCGPARALELVRLSRAAVALQRSNAGLDRIAARCGFANAYHFSRRFASAYGMPPGRFRAAAEPPDPMLPVQQAGLLALARALVE